VIAPDHTPLRSAKPAVRRWPVVRSASAIRADLAVESDVRDTRDEAWLEAVESLTPAERMAAREADELVFRSTLALVHDDGAWVRSSEPQSAVQAPRWALDRPGLPEPACVVLGALLEAEAAIGVHSLGARLGVHPAMCTEAHEPVLWAALRELVSARLVRRIASGGLEVVGR
jgi:hypothetical protein